MSVMGRSLPPLVSGIQKRLLASVVAVAFFGGLVIAMFPGTAYATSIGTRSLTLQSGTVDSDADGINDGGSQPGGIVKHAFSFVLPNIGSPNIGSIKFDYCNEPAGTCTAPTGMSLTTPGSTLGASGGSVFTSVVNSTANSAYITRASALSITAGTTVTARLDSVKNPTTTNFTFFVRISTYAATNATGSPVDQGTVAASTATQIKLTGTMPESLIFCTGETISNNLAGNPDCTTATAGIIAFDQLFSPIDTAFAKSQMAASTNGLTGYSISVSGPTLTNGSYTIPAMAGAASSVGTGQFGMNLVLNTITDNQLPTPQPVGQAIFPASNTTNYKAKPVTAFGTPDSFKYAAGVVANSDDGGTPGPTDIQRYTASYIVNVSGSQPAGTYTTTLTYVCTATF